MKRRSKVAKKTIKDPDLINMFNQMTGTEAPDPEIAIPKYESLLEQLKAMLRLLDRFANVPFAKRLPAHKKGFDEVKQFVNKSNKDLKEYPSSKVDTNVIKEAQKSREKMIELIMSPTSSNITDIAEKYKKLKESTLVQEMIVLCKNLNRHKKYILDRANLSDKFITKSDGFYMNLLRFSSLNFKTVYISDKIGEKSRQYILIWCHIAYKTTYAIWKLVTSPDIDVDKFANLIINNIAQVRKHIPRCDKAFDKIINSVDMLKTNFDGYYKDMVQSKNPGIIIENFILDIANDKKTKADIQTTMQFKRIIQFYKKQSAGRKLDPRVAKIFNMVENNMAALDEAHEQTKPKVEDDQPETKGKAPDTN